MNILFSENSFFKENEKKKKFFDQENKREVSNKRLIIKHTVNHKRIIYI